MAQSLFMALKTAIPGCTIDVLAPGWSLPLLARMPEVSKAIIMPLKHGQFGLIPRIRLGKQLQADHYGQAIVLPNSWKSGLIPYFAKIPIRTGYLGELRWGLLNDIRKLDKSILTMTVQRFAALGLPKIAQQTPDYQLPRLPTNNDGQETVIKKFSLKPTKKILTLCPGAEYGPAKRWPAGHFAEVAKQKLQQGWQVWLLGSEKDREASESINKLTSHRCHDFIGETTLIEAIDLLSLAHTVIANDSGLMHLSAALNKNVIAIYGSTPPEFAPPLCDNAQTVSLNLRCSPCRKRVCPLYPIAHPSHTQCLTGIKPEQILELIGD